jgi:hypothetical protein
MVRRMPAGSPVEGRGWLRIPLPARKPGVTPPSKTHIPNMSGAGWFFCGLALMAVVAVLTTTAPVAMGTSSLTQLLRGPEPSNLIVMALALAVLFVFRRFSRTS